MSENKRARQIVGLSEEDLDEFKCGICHEMFTNPVVTQCCRTTYCADCIIEWLTYQSICPNDRKALDRTRLRAAPRALINILNILRSGCESNNRRKKCNICGMFVENNVSTVPHKCIPSLINKNRIITEENDRLRDRVAETEVQIRHIIEQDTKLKNANHLLKCTSGLTLVASLIFGGLAAFLFKIK